LYGEEAFPIAGRFASAKKVAQSVKSPKDCKKYQQPAVRKLRSAADPNRTESNIEIQGAE